MKREKSSKKRNIELPQNSEKLTELTSQRPRNFFASLKWNYDENNGSIPVFTHFELESLPLKWMKYILLERVGLTTQKELEATIHRFDISHIDKIERKCYDIFDKRIDKAEMMVVFKVVFFDKAGQLPNYRIYSSDEIADALRFVQNYSKQAQEIWLCESSVSDSGSNFGGRVTLPMGEKLLPSLLEIVWFTSPRKIEEYRGDNFPYPFLSASKHLPCLQFTIDKLHIPEKYLQDRNLRGDFIRDSQWVITSLYHLSEVIEILKIILSGAGAKEISLEFKASRGKLSIIDWDTGIETAL